MISYEIFNDNPTDQDICNLSWDMDTFMLKEKIVSNKWDKAQHLILDLYEVNITDTYYIQDAICFDVEFIKNKSHYGRTYVISVEFHANNFVLTSLSMGEHNQRKIIRLL